MDQSPNAAPGEALAKRCNRAETWQGRNGFATALGRVRLARWTGWLVAPVAALLALPAAAESPRVVVTIKPIHSLAAGLLEGIAVPVLLIDGRASPHSYALKPSDARALNNAHVFVRVGPSVEPFTSRIVSGLPQSVKRVTLESIPGLVQRHVRTGTAFEAHEDDAEHAHAMDYSDAHIPSAQHHDVHHHGGQEAGPRASAVDGHIWLDPVNAKLIVSHLNDVLAERYPDSRARLAENAQKLAARIDELEETLGERVGPLSGRPFIVFHDAYQYFEARFNLTAVGAITVNPDVPPSAKRISDLRAKISQLGARCVFAEPQFRARIIETIIQGSPARAGILDPIGFDLEPGPDLYFTLMRNLAAALETCLADPA